MVNQNTKEIMHHGVIGQKWGVRRYQPYGEGGYNPDKTGKFVGKQQKKEYKLAKRTGGKMGYRSVYTGRKTRASKTVR